MDLPQWSNGVGKHILKLEDGKPVVGNIRGPVERFYQHWQGGRSSICPGRDKCQMCQSQDPDVRKATGKFRVNFVMREDASNKNSPLISRIFEGGKRVYDQLIELNKDVPLEKAWVRVTRTGKGQSTQYMLAVVPGDNGLVTPAQEKQIVSVALHDVRVNQPEEESDSVEPQEDALPF